MMRRPIRPVVLVVLLAGCGLLKRVPNQFYALDTIPPAGGVLNLSGAAVGIDGVELPPGLERRGIVIRGAGHKLEVRGTHQWSSGLEEMVMHTLAFDLANRLPDGMVVLPGQARPQGAMRSIYVVLEELAPGPESEFVLDARWTLRDAAGTQRTRHERVVIPMTSMESPAIAAAMSQALATLADRIVGQLRSPPLGAS